MIASYSFAQVVKEGANVTIIARNESRLRDSLDEMRKHLLGPDQKTQSVSLDISSDFSKVDFWPLSMNFVRC